MENKSFTELIQELKALQLREATVLALIEQAEKRRDLVAGHHEGFTKGDRIRISNHVPKPAHWGIDEPWNYRNAQKATVTFTANDRVYFTTDNGVTTWRSPRNIKRI
jgi:hypothetical protein